MRKSFASTSVSHNKMSQQNTFPTKKIQFHSPSNEKWEPENISPTFCMLPWIHLSTRPNGHMRLCCTSNASSAGALNDQKFKGEVGILKGENGLPANFNHTDLKTAWNNSYMRDIRKQMLKGEKPLSCLKCFKEEENGYQSKRIWENRLWKKRVSIKKLIKETKKDGSIPNKLYYVDLRFGTKCNLKCIMCSPHDSSLWVQDWNKLYPQIKNPSLKELMVWPNKGKVHGATYNWYKDNKKFWLQLLEQIPHMQQIYFAGGESTIIPEHYELLKECVKRGYAKNIELRYNSNGVEMPDQLFNLWEKFKRVVFHFSVDSIHKMNDYIRFPSQFSHIEKQLDRIDQETSDSITVTLSCAVQALNIYYLPDFIKWKLNKNFKKINMWPKSAGLIDTHLVYHPAHLNIKVLPKKFKDQVEEKFESFYSYLEDYFNGSDAPSSHRPYRPKGEEFKNHPYGIQRLKGLCRFMQSEDWSARMPEFKEYITKLDQIRKTDFSSVFPEMKTLIQ